MAYQVETIATTIAEMTSAAGKTVFYEFPNLDAFLQWINENPGIYQTFYGEMGNTIGHAVKVFNDNGSYIQQIVNVITDPVTGAITLSGVPSAVAGVAGGTGVTLIGTSLAILMAAPALGLSVYGLVESLSPGTMDIIGNAIVEASETIGTKIPLYFDSKANTRLSAKVIKIIGDKLVELGLFDATEISTTIPKTEGTYYIASRTLTTTQAITKAISLVKNSEMFPAEQFIRRVANNIDVFTSAASQYDYCIIYIPSGEGITSGQYFSPGNVNLFLRNDGFTGFSANTNTDQIVSGDISTVKPSGLWKAISFYFDDDTNYRTYEQDIVLTNIPRAIGMGVVDSLNTDVPYASRTQNIVVGSNFGVIVEVPNPGFNPQPDATYPEEGWEIPTTYPEWWTTKTEEEFPDPEDPETQTKREFLPVTVPMFDPFTQGTEYPQEEAQTGKNPNPEPSPSPSPQPSPYPYPEQVIIDGLPDVPNPNPAPPNNPEQNEGETPPIVPPSSATSTGMVTVYNPSQTELQDFCGWLWADPIIQAVRNIVQNPMDAIIGLQMCYATPPQGSEKEIQVGYLASGVNATQVSNQYTDINCGSVAINEYFHNVNDYSYTSISLYLPFVGIVPLDSSIVMGTTLSVKYGVDVYTGACLAMVSITKDGKTAMIGQYAGNCSFTMPLTSGDNSRLFMAIASTIGKGVLGDVAGALRSGENVLTGGASASIHQSGSISACVGAMGIKKPYLIITRPVSYEAANYNTFYGLPNNNTVSLGSVTGFTRVKDIHLDGIPATEAELNEIEALLKEGVIF